MDSIRAMFQNRKFTMCELGHIGVLGAIMILFQNNAATGAANIDTFNQLVSATMFAFYFANNFAYNGKSCMALLNNLVLSVLVFLLFLINAINNKAFGDAAVSRGENIAQVVLTAVSMVHFLLNVAMEFFKKD